MMMMMKPTILTTTRTSSCNDSKCRVGLVFVGVLLLLLVPRCQSTASFPSTKFTITETTTTNTTTTTSRQQRHLQQECPPNPPDVYFSLSEHFWVNKVDVIMELSELVNRDESGDINDVVDEQRSNYPQGLYGFYDGLDDQALVAKHNGRCYATFSATEDGNLIDDLQNLIPIPTDIPGTDCKVRLGLYSAYYTRYYGDFVETIQDCVNSCTNRPYCPLTLGGDSQGGAVAVIASIDLRAYNPQVITFGAPRVLLESGACSEVQPRQHYRFVNTHPSLGYDEVPNQINIFQEQHVGYPLFLDDNTNWPIMSPNFVENQSRSPRDRDTLHERTLYESRFDDIIARGCFPVPVFRWPSEHYCQYDDECASRNCGNSNECVENRIPVP